MPALWNKKLEIVAQELAAGRSPEEASATAQYPTDASSFKPNARKRAQRKDVVARIAEIRAPAIARAEASAGVTVEWMLTKLHDLAEYNADDYLAPCDENGQRFYDLNKVSRAMLGRLSEARISEVTRGRGRNRKRLAQCSAVKGHDPFAAIKLAAQIKGVLNPDVSVTVNQSMNGVVSLTDEELVVIAQAGS